MSGAVKIETFVWAAQTRLYDDHLHRHLRHATATEVYYEVEEKEEKTTTYSPR